MRCRTCKIEKPVEEFSTIHGKAITLCKECNRAKAKAYARANPEKTKERNRSRRFTQHGITEAEFDALLESQDGGCAICGEHKGAGAGGMAVDHDHRHCNGQYACAECVRGILCSACNRGLGYFQDSPKLLEKAVEYLRRVRP